MVPLEVDQCSLIASAAKPLGMGAALKEASLLSNTSTDSSKSL